MARVTQGCFSLLPDLTDTQIEAQIKYCISNGFAVSIEWTDEPVSYTHLTLADE